MKGNFLSIKFLSIIKSAYEISSKKEKIELLIIPIIISIILFWYLPSIEKLTTDGDLTELTEKFLSLLITISSVMTAFGLATVTILTTSSNENIKKARKEITERKRKGIKIDYFELLLIRNFYNILAQITVLFISIVFTFFSNFNIGNRYILSIGVFLILHSLGSLILTVISIYHLMWKDE